MKGEWRAGLIGFISVGGFATVCILILTDGTNTGSFGGTTALTYTEGSPFPPYADLTQEQVSGWVLSAWTADQTAALQAQLDSQLAVTSPPLPWPAAESVAVTPVAA